MKRYPVIMAVLAIITLLVSLVPTGITYSASPKAFPGAMGFGANTVGGRGGRVIYVTNLNDSGAGSLREALSATGPRTILFKVGGTIKLSNDLQISEPYVTLAGQSAPGQGVQIKGGMLLITTHDVLIRYMKIREGNPTGGNPADTDSISIAGNKSEVYNVVIDHCTLIWGTDIGGLSILTNSHDVTVQDTILGEGLMNSNHPETPHSYSMNLTQLNDSGYPTNITLYHNLITSSNARNPQMIQPAKVDFANNVLYNWGNKTAYGNPKSLNLVNNYYVAGPLSKSTYFWDLHVDKDYPTQNNNAVYESGNVAVGFNGSRGGPNVIYTGSPRFTSSITNLTSAQDAYNYVVNNVGANRPVRDEVDQRIISNLTNRTMRLPNGATNRFIDAVDLAWPNLASGTPPADSDNDGMADSWEQQKFGNTSRGSANNSSSDADGDGYTDLEEYLNNTNPVEGVVVAPTSAPTSTATAKPTVTATPAATFPTAQPTTAPTLAAVPATLKFTSVDDASIEQEKPNANNGGDNRLVVDNNPNVDFFIKFKVSGVNGKPVTRAVLRLYNLDGSDFGGRIKLVPSNNWNEGALTWNNRPDSPGDALAALDQVSPDQWYELDLTSVITGDGTYSFRIVSTSSNNAAYSSKEGSHPPQLVLTVAP